MEMCIVFNNYKNFAKPDLTLAEMFTWAADNKSDHMAAEGNFAFCICYNTA